MQFFKHAEAQECAEKLMTALEAAATGWTTERRDLTLYLARPGGELSAQHMSFTFWTDGEEEAVIQESVVSGSQKLGAGVMQAPIKAPPEFKPIWLYCDVGVGLDGQLLRTESRSIITEAEIVAWFRECCP